MLIKLTRDNNVFYVANYKKNYYKNTHRIEYTINKDKAYNFKEANARKVLNSLKTSHESRIKYVVESPITFELVPEPKEPALILTIDDIRERFGIENDVRILIKRGK